MHSKPKHLKMSKPATLWYRWAKDKKGVEFWDFNHLEDDHCTNNVPTPKHPSHNLVWKGGKWEKDHVYLDQDNKVLPHITVTKESL